MREVSIEKLSKAYESALNIVVYCFNSDKVLEFSGRLNDYTPGSKGYDNFMYTTEAFNKYLDVDILDSIAAERAAYYIAYELMK